MTRLSQLVAAGGILLAGLQSAAAEALTPVHEAGRCAIRGHCGSKSFFGKPLPCVDNGVAAEPDAKLRKQLTDLCGPKWSDGPVCCNSEQVCLVLAVARRDFTGRLVSWCLSELTSLV